MPLERSTAEVRRRDAHEVGLSLSNTFGKCLSFETIHHSAFAYLNAIRFLAVPWAPYYGLYRAAGCRTPEAFNQKTCIGF